jgi:hypothetical protein
VLSEGLSRRPQDPEDLCPIEPLPFTMLAEAHASEFISKVAENRPMPPTTAGLLATGFLFAFASSSFAQTAPVPGPSTGGPPGFLQRTAFFLSVAGMRSDDPRFSLAQRSRADLDLYTYRKGRINFLVDTELVMGRERRAFDLNQANVIFEASLSYGLGPIDVAGVAHHDSKHVVDREFDRVPAWHTAGVRAGHVFLARQSTIDVSLDYGRIVQHTFVDYRWTSQVTIRVDQSLRPGAHVFASGSGGLVGVDRAVLNRDPQTGGRAEGGVRFVAERGVFDLFAAYERRVDGYPTSREPSSWFEVGLRLGAR